MRAVGRFQIPPAVRVTWADGSGSSGHWQVFGLCTAGGTASPETEKMATQVEGQEFRVDDGGRDTCCVSKPSTEKSSRRESRPGRGAQAGGRRARPCEVEPSGPSPQLWERPAGSPAQARSPPRCAVLFLRRRSRRPKKPRAAPVPVCPPGNRRGLSRASPTPRAGWAPSRRRSNHTTHPWRGGPVSGPAHLSRCTPEPAQAKLTVTRVRPPPTIAGHPLFATHLEHPRRDHEQGAEPQEGSEDRTHPGFILTATKFN